MRRLLAPARPGPAALVLLALAALLVLVAGAQHARLFHGRVGDEARARGRRRLVMGCAIAGVGISQAPAEREPAPTAAQVSAAKQRIAGATAARGRRLFTDEGCDRCHSIAAIEADGTLGPRLDTLDEDAGDIAGGGD